MNLDQALSKYKQHRNNANKRKIPFEISFEDWCDIWLTSGHWDNRGKKRGQYVMCRTNDEGPYSKNNVYIDKTENNISLGSKGRIVTPEHLEKNRRAQLGKKRSPETKKKLSDLRKRVNAQKKLLKSAS